MAGDLKAQLELSADATGVETGVSRAKKSIASLGPAATAAGKEASDGISKIGEGSGAAVAKVDAATKSLINSIQRTVAVTEAGGRANSRYFEALAKQRGVDPNALRPFLDQLDAVAIKQKTAADGFARLSEQGRAALDRIRQGDRLTEGLSRSGISAAAAAELRALDAVKARQQTIADGFAQLGQQGRASLDKLLIGQRLTAGLSQAGRDVQATTAAVVTAGRVGANALNQYGQSAKQTAAALRQVPAQLTDIFVGLQGGQAPLTVLLQQGGQLKDVFGGVRPALSAVGSAVLGLINPFTVAAAAATALGIAYFQGSKEADEFAKSLILTGNAAGATVGQLQGIAQVVSGVVGTQGKAAEVVAALAASGRVTRDSLQSVAIAAIKLEREAGKAISETVKEFAELGKNPVEASAKLNEQYNYLTLAVYEQIKALRDQGRETEAVALAQSTFASEMGRRADELTKRLGYVESAWRGIVDGAKAAWDAMLDIGRAETPEQRLATLQARLASISGAPDIGPEFGGDGGAQRAALEAEIDSLRGATKASADAAKAEADRARVQKAGIAAEKEVERIRESSRSNQAKLNDELKKYRENLDAIRKANPDSALLDPAKIKADELAIRDRFKTAAPKPRAVRDDEATRLLQQLREAEAATRAQLTVNEALTASEKKQAEFVQLIADLKSKTVLTADQKSLLAAQDAIKAQLDRNIAVEKEVKARADATKEIEKQQRALEQFQDRAAQLAQSIQSANQNRADQSADRLGAFASGAEARERLNAQIAIQREFQRYQEQLDKATPKELLGSDLYLQEVDRIREGLAAALDENRLYFDRLRVLQTDGASGAKRAFEDYLSGARNVSAQVEQLTGDALKGLEDALVEFTTTGKLSFTDLANSIVADINRIIIRQALIKPIEDLLTGQASGDGIGGLLSKGIGALFGGGGLKVPGFAGGQIDPAKVAQDTAATAATGALTAGLSGAAAATAANTAATASATASTAGLAAAEATAAAAISAASASSALAVGALATSAAAAATALAAVAASAGTEAGGDVLGSFLSVIGGRALGGPVSANSAYRINEKGAPEIASIGGRDYLLTGSQGGSVKPAESGSGRAVVVNLNQTFAPNTSRQTLDQAARMAARAFEAAVSRGTA